MCSFRNLHSFMDWVTRVGRGAKSEEHFGHHDETCLNIDPKQCKWPTNIQVLLGPQALSFPAISAIKSRLVDEHEPLVGNSVYVWIFSRFLLDPLFWYWVNIDLSIYIYFYALKVIQGIVCATWLGSTEVNVTPFALVIVLDYSVLRKLNGHCWPMLHDPSMQTNAYQQANKLNEVCEAN